MAIMDYLSDPVYIVQIAALFTALWCLPLRNGVYPGIFVFYMLLVIGVESTGFYLARVLHTPNTQLYNIFIVVRIFFFSWIFRQYIPNEKLNTVIKAIGFLLAMIVVAEILLRLAYKPMLERYARYSYLLTITMILTCCFIFYVGLLNDNSPLGVLKDGRFWIVTGLFLFYLGILPMLAFQKDAARIKFSGNVSFYKLVMSCLNILHYGCWIIGFICLRKTRSLSPY